jgi:hypothetical protein
VVFCEITSELAEIIKKYARGRKIIDCGAGECELQSAIGDQVVSLDILPYDDTPAIPMDARKFPMSEETLPVFIRPCHSEWVHQTIMKNITRVDSFLYIGLPKNLDTDLICDHPKYKVTAIHPEWTGSEGEKIWQIVERDCHTNDTMLTFALVASDYGLPCWYEVSECGTRLINWSGGWQSIEGAEIVKRTQANGFRHLDWSGTILDDPSQDAGYLDRGGRFYGCPTRLHISCATYRLRKDATALDDEGWVHIYGPPRPGSDTEYERNWICMKTLSAEQRNWLSGKGYIVRDWD